MWGDDGVRKISGVAHESPGVGDKEGGREVSGVAHESPGVGDKEGGREASGVAENPRGSHHTVGGGVELPHGNITPGMTELPRGDETPGVNTAGTRNQREDGRGQGGDENPSTTRATGAQGDGGGDDELMDGPRSAELPRLQRGTAADDGSADELIPSGLNRVSHFE